MKTKKLIIISMIIGTIGTFAFTYKAPLKKDNSYCHYGQCSAYKRDGTRCHSCAQQGSMYCWSHNN